MSTVVDRKNAVVIIEKAVPNSWKKAAGALKLKKKALEAHVNRIRNDWQR